MRQLLSRCFRPHSLSKLLRGLVVCLAPCASADEPATTSSNEPAAKQVVVTLGDSITKGVRSGVAADETFAAIVERELNAAGLAASAVNVGIGGERTDQALKRFDSVAEHRPTVVTIMYGTNDSYVDVGKTMSRLSVDEYRENLRRLVLQFRERGARPILMTEPRWAADAKPNGVGENPNVRLAAYVAACRQVATEMKTPLVDHYAHWTDAEAAGQNLNEWTTDGCHPNPSGHRVIAERMLPALRIALALSIEPKMPNTLAALKRGDAVRVVCFGDSVTGLYYHTGGRRAYTDMLGIALRRQFADSNVTTINAGISGHTTANGLERLDRDVLSHKPTAVTVMFGLNDMTRVPLEQYRNNLREIIHRCREAGAEVLLCTPNNVITTASRPTDRLIEYCDALRAVGKEELAPVCDCYLELDAMRAADPSGWRLLMSDEIHPNMDGHKRIAESIARSIAGSPITSLDDIPPPAPALARTKERLAGGEPIRAIAMPPFDKLLPAALMSVAPEARIEMTAWEVNGKPLREINADAQQRIRAAKPDLVLIAVPRSAAVDSIVSPAGRETFVRNFAWIMNWSLSFGRQEWDVVVVHPDVFDPHRESEDAPADNGEDDSGAPRDGSLVGELVRRLVRAQDLSLVDRESEDRDRSAEEILAEWIKTQLD